MAGTKRASTSGNVEESPGRSTRAKKAKVEENGEEKVASKKTKSKNDKKALPDAKKFKASALPLHFNITHSPPSTETDKEKDDARDPGVIGHLSALPTTFSTGSFGWKGSKKVQVALEGGEGEKVWVQLNINATVTGSKPGKANKKEAEDKEEEAGDDDDDDNEE